MTDRLTSVLERLLGPLDFRQLVVEGVRVDGTGRSIWAISLTVGLIDRVAAVLVLESFAAGATQPLDGVQLAVDREVLLGGVLGEGSGVLCCGFGIAVAGRWDLWSYEMSVREGLWQMKVGDLRLPVTAGEEGVDETIIEAKVCS